MTTNLSSSFASVVADIALFCEFTDVNLLNEDTGVGMLEQLAVRLVELNDADKATVAAQLERISCEYSEEKYADFVRGLPQALGLI